MSCSASKNLNHTDHHDISKPLEAASDNQWPYLQEISGSILLPLENHGTCSGNSSLGSFNPHGTNSSLTKASIPNTFNYHTDCTSSMVPLKVSDNLCSAIHESSNSVQVSDYDKFFGDLNPSNICVEEEYFSALAKYRISEEFPENRFNHQSGGDKTSCEFDPVMLLYEQENPAGLPKEDTRDGGLMESNANNYQRETNLSCPLESSDEMEPIMQESRKSVPVEEENQSPAASSKWGKRLGKGEKNQFRFKLKMDKMVLQPNIEGGSTSKKQQHNAKEKVRRMKLNASYSALASLLPKSQRSKIPQKKWSAPGIIDKVVKYIPELESEIEQLNFKKNTMLSKIEDRKPIDQQDLSTEERQTPTILIHEVRQGEVIIQFCLQRDKENAAVSNLFRNLEEQSMSIVSASSSNVCEERICYNLHIRQMDGNPLGADYLETLRKEVICWLN
ncbi:unnamed protein product [Dovyalis caffra]|uniref:BHLH domain-containing protein n=1 Tax=Dovyalis caffra TaxID=77055 RepID=A0AAV1SSL8_9ROSI|nr:unnamed protein product [Dovyalis caffra]